MKSKSKETRKGRQSKKYVAAAETDPQAEGEAPVGEGSIEESKKRWGKAKRGVAAMNKLLVKKALGKRIKVTYDSLGNPNGKSRTSLQSYIGLLVRTMVPINIKSWPEVDAELKEKIWADIQSTFKVAPESKKLLLSSAGVKFRGFKTYLTKNFVLPWLNNKKHLRKPPKIYKFVGQQPWKEFVKQRMSDEWTNVHQRAQERVKKRKYHHRLSRKGYVGLEEELRLSLPEGEVIDRATKWMKAHQPKEGLLDDTYAEVSSKIDELLEKKAMGELQVNGSEDVLTQALGSSEHSGRVRGVGGFVCPSTYFKMPKRKTKAITKAELLERDLIRTQQFEETKRLLEEQQKTGESFRERIAELEALMKSQIKLSAADKDLNSPLSDKGSCHAPDRPEGSKVLEDKDCHILPPVYEEGGPCELALGTKSNLVAFGTVMKDLPDDKMRTDSIQDGCVRVSVDGSIQSEARLPFPVSGEVETVGQAVGCHVHWPNDLVVRKLENLKLKKKDRTMKSLFGTQKVVAHKMVPKQFSLLYKHAKTLMTEHGLSIQSSIKPEVFGEEKEMFVLADDVINLLEMNMIGQATIGAYMACLHDIVKEKGELDLFAFVDPGQTHKPERKEFVTYIVNRLKEGNAGRLFLIPYNPGGHWLLTVVLENEIYLMDSMPKTVRYKAWEDALINAIKQFNAETGRFNKPPKLSYLKGVPKQPGGFECGYYVMRYMKDIINDESLISSVKWAAKSRKVEYTQMELDEVRFELAEYLQLLA